MPEEQCCLESVEVIDVFQKRSCHIVPKMQARLGGQCLFLGVLPVGVMVCFDYFDAYQILGDNLLDEGTLSTQFFSGLVKVFWVDISA
jgi:hypothetical protein